MDKTSFNNILNKVSVASLTDEDYIHYDFINILMNELPLSFEECSEISKKLVQSQLDSGVIKL